MKRNWSERISSVALSSHATHAGSIDSNRSKFSLATRFAPQTIAVVQPDVLAQ